MIWIGAILTALAFSAAAIALTAVIIFLMYCYDLVLEHWLRNLHDDA